MATPQIAQHQNYQEVASNEYGVSITLPGGIAAGNLLLLIISGFDNTADIHPFSLPEGWISVALESRYLDGVEVFSRVSDGSEGGTTVDIDTSSPIDECVVVDFLEVSGFIGMASDIEASSSRNGTGEVDPVVNSLTPTQTGDVLYISVLHHAGESTVSLPEYTEISNTVVPGLATVHVASAGSSSGSAPAGTYSASPGVSPIRVTLSVPEQGTIPSATVTLDSGNDVRSPGQTISGTYSYFDGDPTGGPLSITSGGVTHSTDDTDPFLTNLTWGTDTVDGNGKHSGTWSVDLGDLPAQGNSAKGLPFSDSAQVTITDPGV